MYVTVRRYMLAGSGEELLRRIKAEYVPILTALLGFKAYHGVDCWGREAMSISFWERGGSTSLRGSTTMDFQIRKAAMRYRSRYRRFMTGISSDVAQGQ
jgi:hypothetical protein